MGLAAKDNRPVLALQDHRMVTVDVSGGGDHVDARGELGLSVEQLVAGPGEVDQVHRGVGP